MIFCSLDRFKQLNLPASNLFRDTAMGNNPIVSWWLDPGQPKGDCYNLKYDVNNLADGGKTQALTTPSDRFDLAGYNAAPEPKFRENFKIQRPRVAFTIDVCTWFLHRTLQQGWPSINKNRIMQIQQPGFRGGVSSFATPVDGLRNTGLSMLHEVRQVFKVLDQRS